MEQWNRAADAILELLAATVDLGVPVQAVRVWLRPFEATLLDAQTGECEPPEGLDLTATMERKKRKLAAAAPAPEQEE